MVALVGLKERAGFELVTSREGKGRGQGRELGEESSARSRRWFDLKVDEERKLERVRRKGKEEHGRG